MRIWRYDCTWDMAENQHRIFRTSGGTVLKTSLFLSCKSLHRVTHISRKGRLWTLIVPPTNVGQNLSCTRGSHPWTWLRNTAVFSWARAHLKLTEAKWKTVLQSDKSKPENCGCKVLIGVHYCLRKWHCVSAKAPSVLKGKYRVQGQNMLPPGDISCRDSLACFRQC